MYRLAAAIVGVEAADDVTQDALLDAWRGWSRMRDRARVRPWVRAIVANRAKKHLRAQRSRPRLIAVAPDELFLDLRSSRVTPDHAVVIADRQRLDGAFERLSADQRVCVALHYSLDISVAEIARALGVPEGTVKSRINAGITRMRAALEGEER